MNNLTYRQLADIINQLPEENKDDNVSIYLDQLDEFYPVNSTRFVDKDDESGDGVLDEGHFYLRVKQ